MYYAPDVPLPLDIRLNVLVQKAKRRLDSRIDVLAATANMDILRELTAAKQTLDLDNPPKELPFATQQWLLMSGLSVGKVKPKCACGVELYRSEQPSGMCWPCRSKAALENYNGKVSEFMDTLMY